MGLEPTTNSSLDYHSTNWVNGPCIYSELLNLWSMRGLNPRLAAHKTATLPTELMDLVSLLVLGGLTVPLHRVGFEPTSTNTLHLECNPLDHSGNDALFYLFPALFYFSFFTSIFLLITLLIREFTLSCFHCLLSLSYFTHISPSYFTLLLSSYTIYLNRDWMIIFRNILKILCNI